MKSAAADESADYPEVPFKASIDFRAIAEDVEKYQQNAQNRAADADAQKVAHLYAQFTELGRETDELRKARNENAKAMKARTPGAALAWLCS